MRLDSVDHKFNAIVNFDTRAMFPIYRRRNDVYLVTPASQSTSQSLRKSRSAVDVWRKRVAGDQHFKLLQFRFTTWG